MRGKRVYPNIEDVRIVITDFDGVLTDNIVITNEDGKEAVRCNRSDGLAMDILRGYERKHKKEVVVMILSTETNQVVGTRARKMGIRHVQGCRDKRKWIEHYKEEQKGAKDDGLLIYIGNDINDLNAMKMADIGVCPNDSHPAIHEIADIVLDSNGGEGCLREFVEGCMLVSGYDPSMLLEQLE